MFNFKRLIKKYSKVPVTLIKSNGGHYDYLNGGEYVKNPPEEIILIDSAVVPLSNSDLKYDEGGTYTTQDRKLYTYTSIKLGDKVSCGDAEYTVQEAKDYSDFDAGLCIYFLKRAGD